MVILHRIPYPIAEKALEAVTDDLFDPDKDGHEFTVPVGRIKSEGRMQEAGVRVRMILCHPATEKGEAIPPACRAVILGQIVAVPTLNIDSP